MRVTPPPITWVDHCAPASLDLLYHLRTGFNAASQTNSHRVQRMCHSGAPFCFCLMWMLHSTLGAKIKGGKSLLSFHSLSDTAHRDRVLFRGWMHCFPSSCCNLPCIHESLWYHSFWLSRHTHTHTPSPTYKYSGRSLYIKARSSGFMAGYGFFTLLVGPHPSNQSSAVFFSHAGTINSDHSPLLLRQLRGHSGTTAVVVVILPRVLPTRGRHLYCTAFHSKALTMYSLKVSIIAGRRILTYCIVWSCRNEVSSTKAVKYEIRSHLEKLRK